MELIDGKTWTRDVGIIPTLVYYINGGLKKVKYTASVPYWTSDISEAAQYDTVEDAESIIKES